MSTTRPTPDGPRMSVHVPIGTPLSRSLSICGRPLLSCSVGNGRFRRRFSSHPRFLAAGAASAGAVLAANVVLERALVGAGVRDSRATAGALDAGSDLGRRATDAVVTGFGLFPDETGAGIAIGLLLAGMLTLLTLGLTGRLRLSAPTTRILTGFVIGLYVLRLLDGWANVPGALAAVPAVILAATVPKTPPARVLLGTALGAVPLVWAVQWKGDHIVQWGGRYLLLTSLLLLILAAIALEGPVRRTVPARALLGVTLVVGLAGLGWHAHRTDIVGGTGAALDELPADTVVVSAARAGVLVPGPALAVGRRGQPARRPRGRRGRRSAVHHRHPAARGGRLRGRDTERRRLPSHDDVVGSIARRRPRRPDPGPRLKSRLSKHVFGLGSAGRVAPWPMRW